LRLLLDEHYPRGIAEELRRLGHDAQAVQERPELQGVADADLLERALAEGRALLTENVRDFMPLFIVAASAGEATAGLVFSSPERMPRSRRSIGAFVAALDALLRSHPGERALEGQVWWLQP